MMTLITNFSLAQVECKYSKLASLHTAEYQRVLTRLGTDLDRARFCKGICHKAVYYLKHKVSFNILTYFSIRKYPIGYISILAFQDDFIRLKKGKTCNYTNENVLKTFAFPSDFFHIETMALNACEIYCSAKKACWGCSRHCKKDCQWKEISDCKIHQNSLDHFRHTVLQKPGNN